MSSILKNKNGLRMNGITEKHNKHNKEHLQLKQNVEVENKLKSKLKQNKIKYQNINLNAPYRSVSEKTKNEEKEKYNPLILTVQQNKDKKMKNTENKLKKEKDDLIKRAREQNQNS
jgi:hypothetical protein